MNIKFLFYFILLFSVYFPAKAQSISKAVFHISDTEIKSVEITEGSIVMDIDNKGNMVSFNSVSGGSYEYFESGYGSSNGRVKSIGNIKIEYWTNDIEGNRDGKVKLIGNMKIDYWTSDLLSGKTGKVRSIGNINIDYGSSDLPSGGEGKITAIGNIAIDYWKGELLSGKLGKIKAIGDIQIDYWTNDLLNGSYGRIKSITGNSPSVYAIRDKF